MDQIFSSSSDAGFIMLVQKLCRDHPNYTLFREPFSKELEKRQHTLPEHTKHLLLYSFGKIGLVTPQLKDLFEQTINRVPRPNQRR